MTIEEAGEVLLEGRPWRDCLHGCEGGFVYSGDTSETCPVCKGVGKILKREYREAYELLGIDPPPPPPIVCDFIVSEEVVLNVINPAAIKRLTINSKITI